MVVPRSVFLLAVMVKSGSPSHSHFTAWVPPVRGPVHSSAPFGNFIYAGCGSMILRDTLSPLHKKIQQYRRNALRTPDRAAHSVREHKAILEAIRAGNADLAAERMEQHILNAMDRALSKEDA